MPRLQTHLFSALLAVLLPACGGASAPPAGSGTIDGSMDGHPFTTVGAAYLIGKPDDPQNTLVIYVFDAAVTCQEIDKPAWDERVGDRTQSLELKLIGQDPGEYPVPADGRPAGGESTDNYTLTSTSGTPAEVSASAGAVSLESIEAHTSATGTFDLTFPTGALKGTFTAQWCDAGTEP